jgi:hypothetical protein
MLDAVYSEFRTHVLRSSVADLTFVYHSCLKVFQLEETHWRHPRSPVPRIVRVRE